MASSIVATLSDAFHSLQSPNLSRRLARRKHNQAYLDFDLDLSVGLSHLHRPEGDYLTLPWLHDAMSLVLRTYSSVLASVPNLSSAKDKRMLEVHLEDSIKLLDACNALKGAISDAHHYVMLVRYAACLADVKTMDDGKLAKVKDALSKCVEFLDARGDGIKVDGCGSLVCTMGDQNPKSGIARNSTSYVYYSEIHAAKVTSVFVLRELAAAFARTPSKFLMELQSVVEDTAWASSLSKLQQNVKDVADLRQNTSTLVLVEELDNLHNGVKGLLCIILGQKTCSTDTVNLSIPIQRIMKTADDMQQGLTMLRRQIDELFRNLVAIRGSFLDALCYCKS